MKIHPILKLILSLALPLGLGAIAGIVTAEAIPNWYVNLNRPSFNPPNWLFGPVWTSLYILLGTSLFMVWNTEKTEARDRAMGVFAIQMVLNFLWSFLFFYFKKIDIAFVEIITMWISILMMLIQFYKIKPWAAYINIPYLLWVSFATVLNGAYFYLN